MKFWESAAVGCGMILLIVMASIAVVALTIAVVALNNIGQIILEFLGRIRIGVA